MKPIKILHIIPGFGGGISSHVRNLISAVDPEQLKMDIIGFSGYPKEFEAEASEKGISLYQFPSVKKNGPIQVLAYLKKVISENQYDVVHCHSDGMRALLFSTVAKQCGVKRFILHAHRSADENDNRIEISGVIKLNNSFGKLIEFEFENGQTLRITPNHKFWVKDSSGNRVVKTAQEIYDNSEEFEF